jgi:glycosyltransferase involved in cell wall biosynthesis
MPNPDSKLISDLALVVIARNESRCIARCLLSVKNYVDRMVVIDTGSRDNTVAIAKSCGAEVYSFAWIDDFSAARNAALDFANADWHLILDADEWLKSGGEAIHIASQGLPKIGILQIQSEFDIDGIVGQDNAWIPRLLPKGVRYKGRIHEQPVSDLERNRLPICIGHDGYNNEHLVKKRNRNQSLLLKELAMMPEDPYILFQLGKDYEIYKDFHQASFYYLKSIEFAPKNASYMHALSIRLLYSLSKSDQLEQAIERAQTMMDLWANSPDFFFTVGNLMLDWAILNPDDAYSQYLPLAESAWLHCLEIGERPDLDGNVVGRGSFLAAHNLAVIYDGLQDPVKADFYKHMEFK